MKPAFTKMQHKIWSFLLFNPNKAFIQIAKEIKPPIHVNNVAKAIKDLERDGYVKIGEDRLNNRLVNTAKVSIKGFYKQLADAYEIKLVDKTYDAIDDFILNPKILNIIFDIKKETAKEGIGFEQMFAMSMVKFTDPKIMNKVKKMMNEDKELGKAFDNGLGVFLKTVGEKHG